MGLLAVPGAPVRRPQSGLDRDELFKPLARRQLFLLCHVALATRFFRLPCALLAFSHAFIDYFQLKSSVPLYGATVSLTSIAKFWKSLVTSYPPGEVEVFE